MNKIQQTAEKILGRALKTKEGLDITIIENAETNLGIKLPQALKDFYLTVGKIELFTDAYEYFAKPEQIYIKAGKLIFLEENQSILSWAINPADSDKKQVTVYQSPNIEENEKRVEWYEESLPLDDFLVLIMYYQCACGSNDMQTRTKGGYKYGYIGSKQELNDKNLWNDFIAELNSNWENVVDNNGLIIYWCEKGLVCFYTSAKEEDAEDSIFLNVKEDDDLAQTIEKYNFEEI